jgi:hypothetical protein
VEYTEYPVICPLKPGCGAYGKPLKEGKFVKEFPLARWTLNHCAAGGVEFSADPQQGYLIVPDISNNTVWAWIARTAKWWAVWAARGITVAVSWSAHAFGGQPSPHAD